jgi:hypothetical protein
MITQFSQRINIHDGADNRERHAEPEGEGEDELVSGLDIGEDKPEGESASDIEDISFVKGEVLPLLQKAQLVLETCHNDVLYPEEKEKGRIPREVRVSFSGCDHGGGVEEEKGNGLIMGQQDVGPEEEKDLHQYEDEHQDSFDRGNRNAVFLFLHLCNKYL